MGKLSLMNMVLIPPELTTETLTFNWKGSTSTTTKRQEGNMYLELFLLIWNQVLWTLLDLDHLVKYLDRTILSLAKVVLVTTGPKDITLKELNLLIPFLMLFERKRKVAIAYKVSS